MTQLPKWIKKELDENIIPEINKLSEKELLEKLKKIVYRPPSSNRTITWRYSLIKKYLKNYIKNKELLFKIKPPDNLTNKVIKLNIEKRDSEKRIIIDEELIKKILSYEKSEDIYEQYIYLLLISGRRLRELTESKFINVKSSNLIIIEGIKKTRGFKLGLKVMFKPLVSKSKFFRIYRKFNRIKKNSNIKNISGNLQRIIKTKLDQNLKAHDLRRIYAVYSYQFRNKDNEKINTFIKEALNHSSIDASLSYTGIKFTFDHDFIR